MFVIKPCIRRMEVHASNQGELAYRSHQMQRSFGLACSWGSHEVLGLAHSVNPRRGKQELWAPDFLIPARAGIQIIHHAPVQLSTARATGPRSPASSPLLFKVGGASALSPWSWDEHQRAAPLHFYLFQSIRIFQLSPSAKIFDFYRKLCFFVDFCNN